MTHDGIYIGLMSGTSLDGISAAVVRFESKDNTITHDLLGFTVCPYTTVQRERLEHAIQGTSPEGYCRLNFDLGEWLAAAAITAMADAGVAPAQVHAIASHGQTIWHVPVHSTWQLGEAAVIAERTHLPVISNFRVRDVAAGGHGAPLVPIADLLLYAHPDEWRLLQNIGGMANVTIVPPANQSPETNTNHPGVRAFDTGPGMAIIDTVVRELYPTLAYDLGGTIAASGTPNQSIVDHLLADAYFALEPPKSTGREYFGYDYAQQLITIARAQNCAATDIVATAVALTAQSIALAYNRFIPEPARDVVVSGGGAKNLTLVRALQTALAPRTVHQFSDLYYDGEAKEAVAFALLGYLHLTNTPGNITQATGAHGPRILGTLTPA